MPQHVYIRRGKYQLVYKDRHSKLFGTLDECLQAWAIEYGGALSDRISDIILDYRANVLPTKAKRTQRDYRDALDRLEPVFGHMRLCDLRPVHIYQYQDARAAQGAKVHVNREIAVLSVVCAHGVRLGHADYNVCKQVRRRPEQPRNRYVTDEELITVYLMASPWMQDAIELVCETGIRLGDLCRLSDENRTPEGFAFEQGKTGRRMLFEWTDDLRRCAKRPPVSYEGFKTAWQRLMAKAVKDGVTRFTFHDLRAKAGSDLPDWRRLGHTDRGTYERIYNRKPVKITRSGS